MAAAAAAVQRIVSINEKRRPFLPCSCSFYVGVGTLRTPPAVANDERGGEMNTVVSSS